MYASETWRPSERIESKLRAFEGRCLRRILKIRWEDRITNKEVATLTGIDCIIAEIKQRRWRWLGHVMRMDDNRHPKIALTWTPQGERTQARPRSTWRRTIYGERQDLKLSWSELRGLAQDRNGWRKFVSALCFRQGVG